MSSATTHFSPKKHLPLTPYGVPLLIWDVIENTWADINVTFTESYPLTKLTNGPVIVWKIYRRLPGKEGVETVAPRLRGYVKSTLDPGAILEQYAQWQTVIYQFDVFAADNQTANDVLTRLEDLLVHMTPILQKAGVERWFFDEQLEDTETMKPMAQDLARRTIRFRCILNRRYTRQVPSIYKIWIKQLSESFLSTNEIITRSATNGKLYDTFTHNWVSEVLAVDSLPTITTATSGRYIENVDFYIDVDMHTGTSTINWISGRRHPLPGEKYYVTYKYAHEEEPVDAGPTPRTARTDITAQ